MAKESFIGNLAGMPVSQNTSHKRLETQICLSAVKIWSITCAFKKNITQAFLWSKGKQEFGPLISIELPFSGFTPV